MAQARRRSGLLTFGLQPMSPFLSHIDGGLWVCVCGHVREWHASGKCGHGTCECGEYDEEGWYEVTTR